ncbi:hypothetical protein [Streptomyces liliifuscus]|uniref:Uncharacterized protein n=1 Tax=Streptomyces liliifuscus TaxID=2797636 RepID=A0A7T7RFY7_9ACTN|nr:hypothetical protein [Streptomyces liliifuscus]QQM45179.1 hypothetical protein JEQ17_41110 [Streptomyces liliifuscus]
MTPDQAAIVDFLRRQYADSVDLARRMENLAATGQIPGLDVPPGQAANFGRVHAAETRVRFLDETVAPYLGTAGPTGRIADMQLRLLAWEHAGVRGYDEAWRP